MMIQGIRGQALRLCLLCSLVLALTAALSGAPSAARAQEAQTITATGAIIGDKGDAVPITFTFSPTGGTVTGASHYSYEWDSTSDNHCGGVVDLVFSGTFAGGDGGAISGTGEGTGVLDCEEGSHAEIPYVGPWNGTLHADGTGEGTWSWAGALAGFAEGTGEAPWHVTFSAQEFQAALAPVVTTQSIYDKYGITIEDSLGDDGYARTLWTDRELSLLNDVLKELPPALITEMAVTRIVRNKIAIDNDGHPHPSARGEYFSCDKTIDPDCTGSSATIRIFDQAHVPSQFANDPDGDRQFKGTILHELTHALQAAKDEREVYFEIKASKGGYAASPVVQNWMDATRNVKDMQDPQYFSPNNGWALVEGSWKLTTPAGNEPPTDYGGTLPTEDMADSVKMYVYDPQALQKSSPQRYNYLRDYIFGGAEYENGAQKQP